MKILVVTQAVNLDNPGLGFFHQWLIELSKRVTSITVICLEKGRYSLPQNVHVLSLGKETNPSKLSYIKKFYTFIWRERKEYDLVFVHMNQEYVLLGWWLWKVLGKRILLWRNHPMGNFSTRMAVWFSDKVFCTSPFSYTARFRKTKIMPVGIHTDYFKNPNVEREQSLLLFGRIDPIKKPEILLDAAAVLKKEGKSIPTVFVGDFKSPIYEKTLKDRIKESGISELIHFEPAVGQRHAPLVLGSFAAYVNATPTGSMDKAIFEAMSCETLVLVSNKALAKDIPEEFIFKEGDIHDLAHAASVLFALNDGEKKARGKALRDYVVAHHSLNVLFDKLVYEFKLYD